MIQRVFQPVEIPVQMDRLRVSTDEEEPITVLQDMAIDNSFDNIPLNYLSPSASPSPDEMIIRQRGKPTHDERHISFPHVTFGQNLYL